MPTQPILSIVIVNYNVKEYLEQALTSILRALSGISYEIFVVDNASVDGSVAHIRSRFPEVNMIASPENLGFGRANNLALEKVQGKYVVLINPDTVVQEDTFQRLLEFFEAHPEAGGATCKIINPDGSFSVDCRHSIPTPMIAFWKVVGLSKLFPRSKIFARYNLTYLDINETYPVPAVSGSFMMIPRVVLEEVGFFDERFFMYCEDIDLCHRINQSGREIWYVPTSQIIHYKGESTKKNNIDYVVTFNKALYLFFQKYYAQGSIFLFRWAITLGIILRGIFIYSRNFLREHFPLILDTLILNLVILVTFIVRMEVHAAFTWADFLERYWTINGLATLVFLATIYYLEVYPHHKFSIQGIIKSNVITFTLVASLTFFFKQFGFSRLVVMIASVISPALMISWRAVMKRYYHGDRKPWGKDVFSRPTIIVGSGEGTASLYRKIRDMKDIGYELLGVVTVGSDSNAFTPRDIPVLGELKNLSELISIHKVRQVIFSSEPLSYEMILKSMSAMRVRNLDFKIAPSNLEVVIGKSSIEKLDDYPLLEIDYAIGKPLNRVVKRALDFFVSATALILVMPVALPLLLYYRSRFELIDINNSAEDVSQLHQVEGKPWGHPLNLWLRLFAVLKGEVSLVGAPLSMQQEEQLFHYKPGLTGLVQINHEKITTQKDAEKYHLFYIKNQSFLLDAEILLKSIFVNGK